MRYYSWVVRLADGILAISIGAALGSAPAAVSTGQAPNVHRDVTFVARDYEFSGPQSIGAGTTRITLLNQGEDLHHLQFIKLPDGKTVGHFKAAIDADPTRMPSWAIRMGGPNAISPGAQAVAILNLPVGRYVVICGIPDARGIPHVGLGMLIAVDIVSPDSQTSDAPPSDLSITAADFSYKLSGPLSAGKKTVRMINNGTQPHEVVVIQLTPGARIKDYAEAYQPGVPFSSAGKPVGGMVGLEPGGEGYFSIDFVSGHYGLICFLPDLVRRAPHFTRGMMLDLAVD